MKLVEKAGLVLIVAGLGALVGYGLYQTFTALAGAEDVPLLIRIALPAAAVGLVFVVVAVLVDRLRRRKAETFEEVDY